MVAEQTMRMPAQRNDAGPGQGRDIDHRHRLIALGIAQRIAENQPPLGISVENLDGLTR